MESLVPTQQQAKISGLTDLQSQPPRVVEVGQPGQVGFPGQRTWVPAPQEGDLA